MKTRSRLLTTLGAGAALATLVACGGGGGGEQPATPEYDAYLYRHSVMLLLDNKARIVNGMYRGEIALDEDVFVKATRDLASLANMMLDGFENETLVPESRTELEAWQNWNDFKAKADALIDGANALAQAAATGGFDGAKSHVETATRTCGQCHRIYRAAKKDG